MTQRDFLPESAVLKGRYEVKKSIYTTQVERNYECYDREQKKTYWLKEFYPVNYCGRGQDGQTVIVHGSSNRSVFETAREAFADEYRQLADCRKVPEIPKAELLFSENNTIYAVLEKPDGKRLSEHIKNAGGRLSYREGTEIIRTILEALSHIRKKSMYFPQITKDSIVMSQKPKREVVFVEFSKEEADVLYQVGSLWYEMLTGLRPQTSAVRPPSELGIELPEMAEQLILRCLGQKESRPALEEILSFLSREKKGRIVLPKRQIALAVAALIFVIAAWKSLLPKEREALHAEADSVWAETADVESGAALSVVSPEVVSVQALEEDTVSGEPPEEGIVSKGALEEDTVSGAALEEDTVSGKALEKDTESKGALEKDAESKGASEKKTEHVQEERKTKGAEAMPKEKKKKVKNKTKNKANSPAVTKKQSEPKSNLFENW